MSTSTNTHESRPARGGMIATLLVLIVVMCAATAVCAWRANGADSGEGVQAAIVAGTICTLAAVTALAIGMLLHNTPWGIHAMLGGTLIRTGIPLAAGAILQAQGGALARGHIMSHLLVLFLCALAVETSLLWRWIHVHGIPAIKTMRRKVA